MSRTISIISVLAVILAVGLSLLNLEYGNLNQDEGWYLYAAKLVSEGKSPYLDFAYVQGPVMPYVYGLLYGAVTQWGVAGGRLVTVVFGLLSSLFAAGVAGRMAQRNRAASAVAAFILVGCNVYQSYFTSVVKTYGLCAMLLMAGLFLLTFRKSAAWGGMACFFCGMFIALAAGTRLSAGVALPIAGVWLIWRSLQERIERKECSSIFSFLGQRFGWVFFGIGGALTLLAVFLPFIRDCPEQLFFLMLGYHSGRDGGGGAELLVLKAGFVSRFVRAYFLFTVLTLFAVFRLLPDRAPKANASVWLLWLCGVAISFLHFMVPIPYDDYQAIVFPVLASALAVSLFQRIDSPHLPSALAFLLLASVAGAFSSPVNEEWFVLGRDRIWSRFKGKSDLALLRDAAQLIQENSPTNSLLLTQDTYLAIEANRDVPVGMEMGAFCYYPDMPREQARQLKFINREMLSEILNETQAPLAAFSGYGFAIEMPGITELPQKDLDAFFAAVKVRYELIGTFSNFGQGHTTMKIFRIKEDN